MAKKIDRSPVPTAAPKQSGAAGEDELAILHPERNVTVAGREITVREYGFVEGLQLRATAQPFLDGLYALASEGGRPPTFAQVEDLLAVHADCVIALIARAADVTPEWIQGLSDDDGYALMQTWWLVNSGFFIRRVVQRLATEREVARVLGCSPAGRASTTRSSAPATAAPPPTSDG